MVNSKLKLNQKKYRRIGKLTIMKIIWSDFAIENLKDIFDYYKIKASSKVAQKIRREILESTKLLIHNPESGQIE